MLIGDGGELVGVPLVVDPLAQMASGGVAVVVVEGVAEEVAQGDLLEGAPEDVEDLAAQRGAGLVKLFEESFVDRAFAGLAGDEVPEMADLALAEAVDASEALFNAVGVPGQVVVDHEVGALEVDAFAGGVGGDEDVDVGVVEEAALLALPFGAAELSVDGGDAVAAAEFDGDAVDEVGERVEVFGEDEQLAAATARVEHFGVAEHAAEFVPLAVLAGVADVFGLSFELAQGADFESEFAGGAGGGGEIDNLGFFALWVFVDIGFQVGDVGVGGEASELGGGEVDSVGVVGAGVGETLFEPFASSLERFVDGGGGGGEAALEDGEGEADGVASAFALRAGVGWAKRSARFISSLT